MCQDGLEWIGMVGAEETAGGCGAVKATVVEVVQDRQGAKAFGAVAAEAVAMESQAAVTPSNARRRPTEVTSDGSVLDEGAFFGGQSSQRAARGTGSCQEAGTAVVHATTHVRRGGR